MKYPELQPGVFRLYLISLAGGSVSPIAISGCKTKDLFYRGNGREIKPPAPEKPKSRLRFHSWPPLIKGLPALCAPCNQTGSLPQDNHFQNPAGKLPESRLALQKHPAFRPILHRSFRKVLRTPLNTGGPQKNHIYFFI